MPGPIPLKEALDKGLLKLIDGQLNNCIMDVHELLQEDGWLIDVGDIEHNGEWCETLYKMVEYPKDPVKALGLGLRFNFAADEIDVVSHNDTHAMLRFYWD